MIDFILRNPTIKSVQSLIEKQNPKVNVHVPQEAPLPSINALKPIVPIISKINSLEESISKLTDDQLKAKTEEFKSRYQQAIQKEKSEYERIEAQYKQAFVSTEKEQFGLELDQAHDNFKKAKKRILDELLPEAFAVVREAGKRTLGMRHFDVQLAGGMVLHNGSIAEMTTGEGKTLMATLPAYLNALTSDGVHVVTVNDYLAKRDSEWMGPVYKFLGLTVGVIQHDMTPGERQKHYACDITYGTNNEFGFDYLRDNMVSFKDEMVQGLHHFAIVDEVDSILIDEARTPLIISGPAEESTDKYYRAFEITKNLKGRRITEKDEVDAKYRNEDLTAGYDYLADEKHKTISITESGEEKAAKMFGVANLHDMETVEYRHHVLQALKAKEFFKMDVDYVVRDGHVVIVDEFTGRLMPGRRWSDGLHQAVEAKEGIKIERENQTLATITFQNYFRMYEKLAGMTGTAYTEANEFKTIYNLDVVAIPTNRKVQRINYSDAIYRSLREKYNAVVLEIEEAHKKGQPVLVGTISIEKSELISRLLKQKGIPHQVLNAKYHEMEANIISQAGRYKGVTIATNMAGRGTDIVLGGNAEYLARSLAAAKMQENEGEQEEELIKKFIVQFKQQTKEEHEKVVQAGGLYVIGTERHESRRIDNQLRGRQGRQGDPGASRFYVSLEDDLMRLFASDRIIGVMNKLGMEEGQVLEHPWLNSAIENAQKRVETHNFEIRKHLLEYDNVMNRQREVVYGLRRSVLESTDVKRLIQEAVADTIRRAVADYLFVENSEQGMKIVELDEYLKSKFNYSLAEHKDTLKDKTQDEINELILKDVLALYEKKEAEIGSQELRHMERMFLLHTIDAKWKDHLYAMDQLKEGVGLRAFGQRDPLIEYKREGFRMFEEMYASISQDVAEVIFKLEPVTSLRMPKSVFASLPKKMVHQEVTSLSSQVTKEAVDIKEPAARQPSTAPIHNEGPKVGRNDPCPCGSGKKYKKCCGINS